MEMKNVFMIVLVILGVCSFAQSLKCWDCHQDDNKDCDDVTSNVEITCQNESDSCSKVVLNGKTQKGCAGGSKRIGCTETEDKKIISCHCKGDFCNSADSFKVFPVLIVSLILASILT